jgi:CHAT domain-containing protein
MARLDELGEDALEALSVGLLYLCVSNARIDVLLLDQDGKLERFAPVPCSDVLPRIDELLMVLQMPMASSPSAGARVVHEFSNGWGRRLLPPADALAAFDVLVIIPHHALHGVPLHLISPRGARPLALTHGISYCSSATLFVRCVHRNVARNCATSGPSKCAALGVDVLTGKDGRYRELAETFAENFGTVIRLDSRLALKDLLEPDAVRGVDVLCVVCHGFHDSASPPRSGLMLKDRRGVGATRRVVVHEDLTLRFSDWPFVDVPPTFERAAAKGNYDVATLTVGELLVHCRTTAQLVALFGCSTGTGTIGSADDYESLAYQWLKVGAASVLANLWEADLSVLADMARRFAVAWASRRLPKALALRSATRDLLAADPRLAERPTLWGSLVLLGDWM